MFSVYYVWSRSDVTRYTIYDRIDAVATINFSTQFGAATIRERRLSRAASIFVRHGCRLKKSVKK